MMKINSQGTSETPREGMGDMHTDREGMGDMHIVVHDGRGDMHTIIHDGKPNQLPQGREATCHLKDLIRRYRLVMVFLMETKHGDTYCEKTQKKVGIKHTEYVNPVGISGGPGKSV